MEPSVLVSWEPLIYYSGTTDSAREMAHIIETSSGLWQFMLSSAKTTLEQ